MTLANLSETLRREATEREAIACTQCADARADGMNKAADLFMLADRLEAALHEQEKADVGVITLCRECGPNIAIDEDGCCLACGANAYPAIEQVDALQEDLIAMNTLLTKVAEKAAVAKESKDAALAELRAQVEAINIEHVIMQESHGNRSQYQVVKIVAERVRRDVLVRLASRSCKSACSSTAARSRPRRSSSC